MGRKKKHEYFNEFPKFCTVDNNTHCTIFELTQEIREMKSMTGLFRPVHVVKYDGVDTLIEDPNGVGTMILEVRSGTILPETYRGLDITWYEHDKNPSKEISLDDILVMCSI